MAFIVSYSNLFLLCLFLFLLISTARINASCLYFKSSVTESPKAIIESLLDISTLYQGFLSLIFLSLLEGLCLCTAAVTPNLDNNILISLANSSTAVLILTVHEGNLLPLVFSYIEILPSVSISPAIRSLTSCLVLDHINSGNLLFSPD